MSALDVTTWGLPPLVSTIVIVAEYIVKIVAVGVVPENRRPSSSSAWLLLILFLPVVGIPLFLLLGSPYLSGRRSRIQKEANQLLAKGATGIPDWPEAVDIPRDLGSLVTLSRNLTSLPMVTGTDHGIRTGYEENIRCMAAAVDEAEEYVDVCIYIFTADDTTEVFVSALERAAARGVTVRVLFDHIGSRKYPGFKTLKRRLDAAGIQWSLMLPFLPLQGRMRRVDLRNHRKLLVVDGVRAFMGSQNMVEAHYGKQKNLRAGRLWNDIMVELTGPIVASLEAVFATDWYSETKENLHIRAYEYDDRLAEREGALGMRLTQGRHRVKIRKDSEVNAVQIVPSGPGFRTEPSLRLFVSLIYLARKRLRIVSPYFVPDESMLAAIVTAAHRGVEVDLFVSEKADQFMVDHAQSSYYEALLEAGVRIFMYPAPAVLHTKCFTVDGLCSVMGSSNMDMRSFGLNYEVSLLAYGGDITERLHEVMDEYRDISRELTAAEWAQRSFARRWLDSAMRLTSALQ